jgi:branched-subunit amino acid transport protein
MSLTTIWIAMCGMGVITLSLRASFLLLPPHVVLPPLLRRALRFVPAAVLTAIYMPELLLVQAVPEVSLHNPRLLAGGVAILIALRFRNTFLTILSGLVALHLFHL